VVKRALAQLALIVHLGPRRAAILGAEDAAVFVFNERVDAAAVGARNRHADAADEAGRQARVPCDFRPVLAAIGRFEETAPRAAARHLPRDAVRLPER